MKKTPVFYTTLVLLILTTACKQKKADSDSGMDDVDAQNIEEQVPATSIQQPIALEKLEGSPAYTDAALLLDAPSNTKITSGGEVDFGFTINNYELGAQTDGPNTGLLANSGKGQHIHFILNNQPYSAHYVPSFKKEIPDGVHHLVAFLSRSYHESVKNENSVVVQKLEVGPNAQDTLGLQMEAPTIIYSRPKGEYSKADAEDLLLDFFVLNTTLSETGNKVRATINGETFMITEWVPHVIKGLSVGEVTVQLELIDADGNSIDGPFNNVTRTVTVKP